MDYNPHMIGIALKFQFTLELGPTILGILSKKLQFFWQDSFPVMTALVSRIGWMKLHMIIVFKKFHSLQKTYFEKKWCPMDQKKLQVTG